MVPEAYEIMGIVAGLFRLRFDLGRDHLVGFPRLVVAASKDLLSGFDAVRGLPERRIVQLRGVSPILIHVEILRADLGQVQNHFVRPLLVPVDYQRAPQAA